MSGSTTLWDLPTRVFHWSLPLLLPLAWWTAEEGEMERHAWVGYTLLTLVLFRVLWGLFGSRHSRFSDFLRGPKAVLSYVRGQGPDYAGHNPLGGWSVVVMLLLLLLQAVSGLFNSDDVLFDGPLHYWAADGFRDTMGAVHEWAFNLLLGFVVLHLAVVLYYQFSRRQPLVQAMVRGRASGREGQGGAVPAWRALLLVGLVAGLLWVVVSNAPQPAPLW